MATFGQGINASLGRIDYSPFLQGASQGAQMRAQGMQQLGAGLAQGIQQYQANKKLALDAQNEFEEVASVNPSVLEWLQSKQAPEAAQKAFVKMQKNGTLGLNDATTLSSAARGFLKSEQIKQIKAQQDFQNSLEQQRLKIEKDRMMNERIASMRQMFGGEAKGPSVPSGYRMTLAGGLEPIPGGPADTKTEGTPAQLAVAGAEREAAKQTAADLERIEKEKREKTAAENQAEMVKADLDITLNNISKAKALVRDRGAGGPIEGLPGVRAALSVVGRTAGKELENIYTSIRSQLSLAKMQALKAASATGATGLGPINQSEFAALENSIANIDTSLPEEAQIDNLNQIQKRLQALRFGSAKPSGPRVISVEPIN